MTISNTEHLTYEIIEGGIHLFTLFDSSSQTLDDFFDRVETITHNTPDGQMNRYLIVRHATGTLSMAHMMRRANSFFSRFRQRPQARIAMLGERHISIQMIDKFIRGMSAYDKTQVFSHDEYNLAVDWLLADD